MHIIQFHFIFLIILRLNGSNRIHCEKWFILKSWQSWRLQTKKWNGSKNEIQFLSFSSFLFWLAFNCCTHNDPFTILLKASLLYVVCELSSGKEKKSGEFVSEVNCMKLYFICVYVSNISNNSYAPQQHIWIHLNWLLWNITFKKQQKTNDYQWT